MRCNFRIVALLAAAGVAASLSTAAWSHPVNATAKFEAVHIERTATLSVPLPPDRALQLFTPEGERSWAPGWDPEYLYRPGAEPVAGTVFRTRHHGGDPATWCVQAYDPAALRVEYVHVLPGVRMGTIQVRCRPSGGSGTTAEVSYRLTGLSADGNQTLTEMTEAAFAGMIQGWGEHIRQNLEAPGHAHKAK